MTTASHCQLLVDLFKQNDLNAAVTFRHADLGSEPISIWPYAVDVDESRKNQPPRRQPPAGKREIQIPGQRTHLMVIPSTLADYDKARAIVLDHPVLQSDGPTRLVIDALPLQDMIALFSSIGVSFQLALAVAILEADVRSTRRHRAMRLAQIGPGGISGQLGGPNEG